MARRAPLRIDVPAVSGMEALASRCIPNVATEDVLRSYLDGAGAALAPGTLLELRSLEARVLEQLRAHADVANADESVYTGGPGLAFAFVKAAVLRGEPSLLSEAEQFLQPWEEHHRRSAQKYPDLACSLLCGLAGQLCVEALRRGAAGDAAGAAAAAGRYLELSAAALAPALLSADEWLYGRAGYLHGLLLLQGLCGAGTIPESTVEAVAVRMLQNGVQCAQRLDAGWPLMWTWHGKAYLGGAHGVAGILYMLMHVRSIMQDVEHRRLIVATLDKVIQLKTEEGNFPVKCGERRGDTVHFCHGAPGFVWLFCKAYEVLKDARYLDEACAAGNLVWACGLLKKGPGLCHGVSGNAYALLAVYKASGQVVWLARACHFALRMLADDVIAQQRQPDNPLSLFEGLAGGLCLLLDLRADPRAAALPLFELGGLGPLLRAG